MMYEGPKGGATSRRPLPAAIRSTRVVEKLKK